MKRTTLSLAALFVVGCGHTETHHVLFRTAGAPASKPVELYMAEQPVPERPFYEIAMVQAIGFGSEAHPEDVAHALTVKAGSLGCDAVLRATIDIGYSRAHAAGICVKWLADGPPAPPPVLPKAAGDNPTPPPLRPSPAPRIEPLPSAGPAAGGGR